MCKTYAVLVMNNKKKSVIDLIPVSLTGDKNT